MHRGRSRLCGPRLRQAGSCGIREEPESSPRLQRLVNLPPREARGGVPCVGGCADTRVPPTHACSYLLAQAATRAMAAKDAEPAARPAHGGTAAPSPARRMASEGQEAGQPPSLMLITEQPSVRARIVSGFSFSCKAPCGGGGAGTLAGGPARSRRSDIYIFLGWPLPLAETASSPPWEPETRGALPGPPAPAPKSADRREGAPPRALQQPHTPGALSAPPGRRSASGLRLFSLPLDPRSKSPPAGYTAFKSTAPYAARLRTAVSVPTTNR